MSLAQESVNSLREKAVAKGYELVRVKSGGKAPVGIRWTSGEPLELLLRADSESENTGILARGLRPIDVDVEDAAKVKEIFALAVSLLGQTIMRRRNNSARITILYRAAEGAPKKLVVSGKHGKVEALGDGQQFVAFGTHPSGATLVWLGDRSPANVPKDGLRQVTELQVAAFLEACLDILEPEITCAGKISLTQPIGGVDNSDLGSGIESSPWFNSLSPSHMAEVVAECLSHLDNRKFDPREFWLKVLFAVSDAERRGCPNARQMVLDWSKQGAKWISEQDFDSAWDSARPDRLSVGTLIYFAQKAGADLTRWQAKLVHSPTTTSGRPTALHLSDLPPLPPKREWLHGTDAARGAVTMLAAPGGRGKSSWLIALALAVASGRPLLGAHIFGGPLRVLYINAEDSTAEISLRLHAALQHHNIQRDRGAGLAFVGADTADLTLLRQEGQAIRIHQQGFDRLIVLLDAELPDIVIIDPLVSVMGGVSLNDNSAASVLMKALTRLAAERKIAIVVAHHTSKGRDVATADAAMGAASFVNLSRIVLSLEVLNGQDLLKIGLSAVEAGQIFRIGTTKQNLAAAGVTNRLFRVVSVEVANAKPPIYLKGDSVGTVELVSAPAASIIPQTVLDAAAACIAAANPPLSLHTLNFEATCATVGAAVEPAMGRPPTQTEIVAVIERLKATGRVAETTVTISRKGHGKRERRGLIVV